MTYWISLDFATFGLIATGDIVTQAAPIARWTIGKPLAEVLAYYRPRGAIVQRLEEQPWPSLPAR